MKYNLEIIQEAGGQINRINAPAYGGMVDGGLELRYIFDGADYKLIIKNGEMVQTRTGGINLNMIFLRGKSTICRLSDGGNDGFFDIFTQSLSVEFKGGGCVAACEFSDGCGGEITRLTVTAEISA